MGLREISQCPEVPLTALMSPLLVRKRFQCSRGRSATGHSIWASLPLGDFHVYFCLGNQWIAGTPCSPVACNPCIIWTDIMIWYCRDVWVLLFLGSDTGQNLHATHIQMRKWRKYKDEEVENFCDEIEQSIEALIWCEEVLVSIDIIDIVILCHYC